MASAANVDNGVDPETDELITSPAFVDYQLRVTDPELCDPSVKQHSGYLDISDGKHLFFWCVPSSYSMQRTRG